MKRLEPIAVLAAARTPQCKAFTELKSVPAVDLGVVAVQAAIKRSFLSVQEIDQVIFGNVSGPAEAANIARVISLKSGVPADRIAHTVNRNCASGMEAIISAWHRLEIGEAACIVAGGTESMSNVPLLYSPRAVSNWTKLSRSKTLMQKIAALSKFRPRDFNPVVALTLGLTDPYSGLNMGQTAELLARELDVSREEQDEFALESHVKAAAAQQRCFLSGEIEALHASDTLVQKDNGIRAGQTMAQLAKLKPIFEVPGSVTAGNSCPITDGAAAMVLATEKLAVQESAEPLGYITGYTLAGCDPARMGLGPVFATAKLMRETGLKLGDFDLIEINEAFAAQVIACKRAFASDKFAQEHLGRSEAIGVINDSKLNVNGGAIALGHPVGMTGTRLVMTLLRALRERGLKRGLATLCVGGGQGVAVVVETELNGRLSNEH